jgi:hypothetical protein
MYSVDNMENVSHVQYPEATKPNPANEERFSTLNLLIFLCSFPLESICPLYGYTYLCTLYRVLHYTMITISGPWPRGYHEQSLLMSLAFVTP